MVYDNIKWYEHNGYWENDTYGMLHRYVWEKHNGCKIPEGYIIHHKNENRTDFAPSNLVLMTRGNHSRLHRKGYKMSEEGKRKISEANTGRKLWPEGRIFSKETIQKMSEAAKARPPVSEETKAKLSELHKGKPKSEEHKAKLSQAAKNRPPISEETRRKIGEASKGRKHKRPII